MSVTSIHMAMVEIQATKNAETYMCMYITDKCIIIDNLNPVYDGLYKTIAIIFRTLVCSFGCVWVNGLGV